MCYKLSMALSFFSLRCIKTANEGITSKLRSHPLLLRIMTLNNLLLDKIDSLVIRNKLIELYHTILCAAIPRESNNTNENKTLRILNQAYADLMIQRSTLKPLGTYKYAQQLHNRIFCVEHTGSFSVYTLEGCTKYISRWGFPLWQTMTSEWQHRVHTVINIQKYDVHITIYSSGTIPLQYDQTKHFKRYEKIVRHYSLEQLKHHFSF